MRSGNATRVIHGRRRLTLKNPHYTSCSPSHQDVITGGVSENFAVMCNNIAGYGLYYVYIYQRQKGVWKSDPISIVQLTGANECCSAVGITDTYAVSAIVNQLCIGAQNVRGWAIRSFS